MELQNPITVNLVFWPIAEEFQTPFGLETDDRFT